MGLAGEDAADESCALNIDGVDRAEVGRIEAVIHEGLDVELKVEPDTLKDHPRGDPGMQGLPGDVVLRVCVLCPTVEDQTFLLFCLVREDHFDVKLRLVEHFNLEAEIRLE